jgi:hypothetical protein
MSRFIENNFVLLEEIPNLARLKDVPGAGLKMSSYDMKTISMSSVVVRISSNSRSTVIQEAVFSKPVFPFPDLFIPTSVKYSTYPSCLRTLMGPTLSPMAPRCGY